MERTWTAAQLAAMQTSGTSLLISAAAGSGKTATLTERIIRKIINGADISRLLIVTFTRAAAAELRSRISDALSLAIAEHPENKHLAKQLISLGNAKIQTIDSFCLSPVKDHFERLGLPASFRIADESELSVLENRVINDTIRDFYEKYRLPEKDISLAETNRFALAMNCVMPIRDDGKRNSYLLNLYHSLLNFREGVSIPLLCAKEYSENLEIDFFKTSAGSILQNRVMEEVTAIHNNLVSACSYFEEVPVYEKAYLPAYRAEAEYCKQLLSALSVSYENAYLALQTPFPSVGVKGVKKDQQTEHGIICKTAHTLYIKNLKTIEKRYFPVPPEQIRNELEQTAEFCCILGEFLTEYDHRIHQEKLKRGICDFSDITRNMLTLLLNDDGTPTDLAQSLSDSFDEVYIDEYQDVNEIQDFIFSLIGGNHRFMVGDIKQSIYGFRGADPSLFASYRKTFLPLNETGDSDGRSIFMSENFRCDENIIRFTNLVCDHTFSTCADSIGYQAEDQLVKGKKDPDHYQSPKVSVTVFDTETKKTSDSDTESEKENETSDFSAEILWIAKEIQTLILHEKKADGTPIHASDIAVLTQQNGHLEEIVRALRGFGIESSISGNSELSESVEMTMLMNLLSVIDNPQMDVPLSELLLSPLFGFSADDLITIRRSASVDTSLFDAIQGFITGSSELELTQKASAFCEKIGEFRLFSRKFSADQLLREVYKDSIILPYTQSPAFLCAYEYARTMGAQGFIGLYGFLQSFSEILQNGKLEFVSGTAQSDAVTLTSIHHSKGLEFPVCFVAKCGSLFQRKTQSENLVYHKKVGLTCRLSDSETLNKSTTLLREAAIIGSTMEREEEDMRVLYVALTRARERLYLTATARGSFDSLMESTILLDPNQHFYIRTANSFIRWILSAMHHHKQEFESVATLSVLHQNDVFNDCMPVSQTVSSESDHRSIHPTDTQDNELLSKLIHATNETLLPQKEEQLQNLPTKVAASKISFDFVDKLLGSQNEEEEFAIRSRLELMQSASHSFASLLHKNHTPTAAECGTAAHEFLQYCDFEQFFKHGTEAEFSRLVKNGFLQQRVSEIANRDALEKFRTGAFLQRILAAESVEREVQFSLFLPLSEFSMDPMIKESLRDRTIHIQGSIDLILTEHDSQKVLIDYKTDRIPDSILKNPTESELSAFFAQRHQEQLSVYRRAVYLLYGQYPKATYIYSIPLGTLIEIPF